MYRICVVTTPFLPLLLQPTQKLSVRLACASSGRRETGHVFRERPQRLQLGLHWWVPPGPAAALSSQPGRYLSTAERASSRAGITRRHTHAVHPGQCSAVQCSAIGTQTPLASNTSPPPSLFPVRRRCSTFPPTSPRVATEAHIMIVARNARVRGGGLRLIGAPPPRVCLLHGGAVQLVPVKVVPLLFTAVLQAGLHESSVAGLRERRRPPHILEERCHVAVQITYFARGAVLEMRVYASRVTLPNVAHLPCCRRKSSAI